MTPKIYLAKVEKVQASGWGVLVSAYFLDRGPRYDGDRIQRPITFMASRAEHPRIGDKLRITVEEDA